MLETALTLMFNKFSNVSGNWKSPMLARPFVPPPLSRRLKLCRTTLLSVKKVVGEPTKAQGFLHFQAIALPCPLCLQHSFTQVLKKLDIN